MSHSILNKQFRIMGGSTTDFLAEAIRILAETQAEVSDFVPGATNMPISPEQVRTYAFALISEVTELANAIGWKPWKQLGEILEPVEGRERVIDEMADILAFLGLLMYYLTEGFGITPAEIADKYHAKSMTNVARFHGKIEGYPKLTK